jgi:hypothetical protein
MSSIIVAGDVSGSVTLQAPSAAGTTTLTLPTTSGTIVTTNTMPAGSVLQVVNATYSTTTTSSTSTFADTGLTATITPSSSSNKILILVNLNGCAKATSNTNLVTKLLRNSTDITWIDSIAGNNQTTTYIGIGSVSTCYLDSPATTSATTYKVQFASMNNTGTVYINDKAGFTSTSAITLMEIKG